MQNKFCKLKYTIAKRPIAVSLSISEKLSWQISQGQMITATVDKEPEKQTMRKPYLRTLAPEGTAGYAGTMFTRQVSRLILIVCVFDFSHFNAMTKEELQRG